MDDVVTSRLASNGLMSAAEVVSSEIALMRPISGPTHGRRGCRKE